MKTNEIRDLTEKEIRDKINDLEEELFNLRFQATLGQLGNPILLRSIRKDIARSKTVLSEKIRTAKTK